MRHNPALAAYLIAWQDFLTKLVDKDDFISLYQLGQEDLAKAIANYRNWKKRPQIERPLPAPYWQNPNALLHMMGGEGSDILLIPSLINGHQILDLCANASLIDHLRAAGFRIHLLSWDNPKAGCNANTVDYVQAIINASSRIEAPHQAIGYCIGGTLLNLAAPSIPNLQSQILLGAPWNFHHEQGRIGAWAQGLASATHIERFLHQTEIAFGLLPSIMVDHFFAGLNPLQFVQKFRDYDCSAPMFDVLEDWLNSGHDLALPFARDLLENWLRENVLMNANHKHAIPTLVAFGARDHIAPPASCLPLTNGLSSFQTISHPSGHVGLMIGSLARANLWPKLIKFLQNGIAE